MVSVFVFTQFAQNFIGFLFVSVVDTLPEANKYLNRRRNIEPGLYNGKRLREKPVPLAEKRCGVSHPKKRTIRLKSSKNRTIRKKPSKKREIHSKSSTNRIHCSSAEDNQISLTPQAQSSTPTESESDDVSKCGNVR